MSTSAHFKLSDFPHKVLDPIATLTVPPTYATIKRAQRQLMTNAAAIPTLNGGGAHGHMALTLTALAYADISDVPFVIPVAPPANPPPGATQPQITENNRIHQRDADIYNLYVAVNNALRQQLLDAVPRIYVRALAHPMFEFSNVTCLDLLSHLWTKYGTIKPAELQKNFQSMYTPWNTTEPLESVFLQLDEAIAFSIDGNDPISEAAAVRAGYEVIAHSGLLPLDCKEWRKLPTAAHTLAHFQQHFSLADDDRRLTATTGSLGYANVLAAAPSLAPATTSDTLSLPFSALSVSQTSVSSPDMTYCWTHGTSKNRRHTSATCKNKAPGHRDDATATNTLGGSTKERGTATPMVNSSNTDSLNHITRLNSSVVPSPPSPHTSAIADTGCTGHYITVNCPHTHKRPASPSLAVRVPNGAVLRSSHIATLALPGFSPSACQAHIFPGLTSHPLISIGQLCDDGCTATFSATRLEIHRDTTLLLSGTRAPTTGLWHLDLTPAKPPATAHALVPNTPLADRIAFVHASLFSPAISTWCQALDSGHLATFPALSSRQVRKYPPHSPAMVKGHLDQQRANLRSTKLPPVGSPITTEPPAAAVPDLDPPDAHPVTRTHHVFVAHQRVTGQIYTDQPGRFLTPSSAGHNDMLVLYDYDSNAIHVELMKNKSGPEILAAYKRAHALLTQRGLRPQLQRLDNEASAALQSFMSSEHVDFQLAPPHLHRRNAAERAIRTFKNHFIAGLCTTNPDFPLHLWDRLLPQALITLNLLRRSRINPKLSAHAQLHGAFDYNRTPLAPPGTRVLVHVKPAVRETWAPHAVEGWYLGPALNHYRCHRVWITETRAERVADTLSWFPTRIPMPAASSTDRALAAARDLVHALQNPSPASPFAPLDATQHQALTDLATLFATVAAPADDVPAPAPVPPVRPPAPTTPLAQVRFAVPLVTAKHAPALPRPFRGCPPWPPITLAPATPAVAAAKHAHNRQPQP
ncbi:predicted protein [Phaeodactylum tricornutum CCAP 1055/1]|uniref:Integrase catalytic domain-containing protein n=5 Tax=Phaeodactylum tricornutum TaxID=2850 RepID=B7G8G6_PHATC|nr:predicted protein [Phaeodactylum tricornutum CCAP 1055/1]EEC45165.1 predicted protein [Phaeodactylum tricornutum CCAP 1055/1]|eukprot:XP_002183465.1 predicted protein [Phaeodactylum tricornutum CCAP 1055/1]